MQRKIEKSAALDRALTLFWDRGYRGTSMEMLTACLGVEKPSIYASFGSKHQLYLAALQHYRQELIRNIRAVIDEAPSARLGIERAVRRMMTLSCKTSRKGCFATNSALELADHDAAVKREVRSLFLELTALFAQALKRARSAGQVRRDVPATLLAQLLVNAVEGARVVEKARSGYRGAAAVANLILQVLDPKMETT